MRAPNLFILLAAFLVLLPVPNPAAGGDIEGRVLYRGQGVPGVYIEAFGKAGEDADAVGSGNTGSDGQYTIELPPGSYSLTARKRPETPGSGGMLYGTTGKELVEVGRGTVPVPAIQLRNLGSAEGVTGETTVSGTVQGPRGPIPGAYIYFYPGRTRRGPAYLARARSREKGRFSAEIAPGIYTVTVRFGASGSGDGDDGMGTVTVGDLVGDHPSNPVRVTEDNMDLGVIELRAVDPERWARRQWAALQGGFTVSGKVITEDSAPMSGAYVFLYDDRRMVGKPVAISAPTDGDGQYRVVVTDPGTYYLGARTRYGGPVEPGEYMGAWDERGPRPVVLREDASTARCDIVVREVW